MKHYTLTSAQNQPETNLGKNLSINLGHSLTVKWQKLGQNLTSQPIS